MFAGLHHLHACGVVHRCSVCLPLLAFPAPACRVHRPCCCFLACCCLSRPFCSLLSLSKRDSNVALCMVFTVLPAPTSSSSLDSSSFLPPPLPSSPPALPPCSPSHHGQTVSAHAQTKCFACAEQGHQTGKRPRLRRCASARAIPPLRFRVSSPSLPPHTPCPHPFWLLPRLTCLFSQPFLALLKLTARTRRCFQRCSLVQEPSEEPSVPSPVFVDRLYSTPPPLRLLRSLQSPSTHSLARLLGSRAPSAAGTLWYRAPELVAAGRADCEMTSAVDVWAAGLTLCELLLGTPVSFSGGWCSRREWVCVS